MHNRASSRTKINIDHAQTGRNHVQRCLLMKIDDSPSIYPLTTERSWTVNHDGINRQKSCSHSFSGEANQNGCPIADIRTSMNACPDTVVTMVAIIYITNSSVRENRVFRANLENRKLSKIKGTRLNTTLAKGVIKFGCEPQSWLAMLIQ